MKYLQSLLLGTVVGFLVAVSPGCGPTTLQKPCTVDTCQGCCDPTLGCLTGTDNSACGNGAVSCQQCATGQSCDKGVCRITSVNPPADAGVKCGPTTCATGCCNSKGVCELGTAASACGKGGAACSSCTSNQTCQSGQCTSSQTCNGCTDAFGTCFAGNTNQACGSTGTVCVACLAGQSCVNGVCTGGGCNSSNCSDGCCSGDLCIRGQPNNVQCGQGGAACVGCQSPAVCQADGGCAAPSLDFDGGLFPTCGAGSPVDDCQDGCCQGVGVFAICIRTPTLGCGLLGSACKICNPLTEACSNGVCQPR